MADLGEWAKLIYTRETRRKVVATMRTAVVEIRYFVFVSYLRIL